MTETAAQGWIDIHKGEHGLWHATSVLVPGMRVTEFSRAAVLSTIPVVLAAMAKSIKDCQEQTT